MTEEQATGGRLRYLDPRFWWRRYRFHLLLTVLITSFLLLFLWPEVVVSVYPGQQGVYWSRFLGGTTDDQLTEGIAVKFPWDEIIIYDVRLQVVSGETHFLTTDGMKITVLWNARFRPRKERLNVLHQTIGPDYVEKIIVPEVTASLRSVIGNFRPHEVYSQDEEALLIELTDRIREQIEEHPIYFSDILINRLLLPEPIAESIEEKLVNEQKMLAYEYRLKAEEMEKKRRQVEAQGIERFEAISGIPILRWKGIEATLELARSPNTKIVVVGTNSKELPIILNAED